MPDERRWPGWWLEYDLRTAAAKDRRRAERAERKADEDELDELDYPSETYMAWDWKEEH